MNIESILKCSETLGEMIQAFADIPGCNESTKAAAYLAISQSYATELAIHLQSGKEMFDAVSATALGQLEIAPAKALIMQILAAKPKN